VFHELSKPDWKYFNSFPRLNIAWIYEKANEMTFLIVFPLIEAGGAAIVGLH